MLREDTIPLVFKNRVKKYKNKILIQYEFGNKLKQITWNDCNRIVTYYSLYLLSIGVKKEDRIVLLSKNRPEWILSDLAITSIGAINVTMLLSCGQIRLKKVLDESSPKVIMVDSLEIIKDIKIENLVKKIIIFDAINNISNGIFIDFNNCIIKGRKLYTKRNRLLFAMRRNSIYKNDTASIIYNMVASGEYKGVMLTHENLLSNCKAFAKTIHVKKNDISFHFNSFSLIFGRICGYYLQMYRGATISLGNLYHKISGFDNNGITMIFASPFIYANIYKNFRSKIHSLTYLKRKIIILAIKFQMKYIRNSEKNEKKAFRLFLKFLFARTVIILLVSKKIKKYFIKTKCRLFIVGGAYLDRKIPHLFYCLGLRLLEGYGLTECGVVSVNLLNRCRIGTVGRILPNIKIRIEKDGEILIKGPNVMKGYYNDSVGTEKMLEDGWFHTGDVGYLDRDYFLRLSGLKKNILVTTNGININPDTIEGLLKNDEFIDSVVIFGDKKPYLVALVSPNLTLLREYITFKLSLSLNDYSLLRHPQVEKFIAQRIIERLSGLSKFEQIKEFKLVEEKLLRDLKISNIPLKDRRNIIYNEHEELINKMYSKNQ